MARCTEAKRAGVSAPANRQPGARPWILAFAIVMLLSPAALPATVAAKSAQTSPARTCDGAVRLLSDSLVISGVSSPLLGTLILDLSGPLDDLVTCESVGLRSGTARANARGCTNAQVPGPRLRPKTAAKAIRCLIDGERLRRGLPDLESRSELTDAAKYHTHLMLSDGCFSHQCAGEPDLVARTTAARYLPCNCTWIVAENLAWGLGAQSSPAAIVDAWMHSPPHRETLLMGQLKDVGVAVRDGRPGDRTAPGSTYTADFGVKR